jgi:hypothetical protein
MKKKNYASPKIIYKKVVRAPPNHPTNPGYATRLHSENL